MKVHHANLLVGSQVWGLSMLPEHARTPSPDVSLFSTLTFSMPDARRLGREASLKPVLLPERTFIISCETMLHEAQNALLKLFEDPNPSTVFYLIVPREDMLLRTLRSRLNLAGREADREQDGTFARFLSASYSERFALIEEKLKNDDSAWTDNVLRGAEALALARRDPRLIREVMRVSSYFRGPGESRKMLLEHLALTL